MKNHYKDNSKAIQSVLDGRGQNKPFDIFTLDGTFVKTFTYQYEAKAFLQKKYDVTPIIALSVVLTGRQKSSAVSYSNISKFYTIHSKL